jgi:AcrR family transcriptional regulator
MRSVSEAHEGRARQSRPQRRSLTHEEIYQAGLRLVDSEGLEALTMRRLAQELDVGTMTLYGYVTTKQQIFEGAGAIVLAKLAVDVKAEGSWQEQISTAMRDIYLALREHPRAIDLLNAAPSPSSVLDPIRRAMLASLTRAGFGAEADDAIGALYSYTVGCAIIEATREQRAARRADDRIGSGLPSRLAKPSFEYGLERLIESLARRVQRFTSSLADPLGGLHESPR